MTQAVPVFVINLDRRTDRLAYISDHLGQLGLDWHRIAALDAQTATDTQIAAEVDLTHQLVGMGRGSQCCAVTTFDILRHMIDQDIPAALILQDDIHLSPQITPFLENLDWLPSGIGIVQFEKYGRKISTRLTGAPIPTPVSGRHLHRLYSRTAGAGCFLITQQSARIILSSKGKLRTPIDHYLFSPNVPNRFHQIGVGVVMPALAEQRDEDLPSDLAQDRAKAKPLRQRLRRSWLEVNRMPQQMWQVLCGARWRAFEFRA